MEKQSDIRAIQVNFADADLDAGYDESIYCDQGGGKRYIDLTSMISHYTLEIRKELAFFQRKFISVYDRGRRSYNGLCRKCQNECKQSFRTVIIDCPRYLSK